MSEILELGDRLLALRDRKDELEKALKALNEELDKTELTLVRQMTDEETPLFNRQGRTLYLTTRTYASPAAGAKEQLYSWLKQNGYEDLVKETVHAQSLSSLAKEMLEESDDLPEDLKPLMNVFDKTSIGVRKGK